MTTITKQTSSAFMSGFFAFKYGCLLKITEEIHMDYAIHSEVVGDILIDAYRDLLYASFVYKGKRYTQCYRLDATEDEIKTDAEKAVNEVK